MTLKASADQPWLIAASVPMTWSELVALPVVAQKMTLAPKSARVHLPRYLVHRRDHPQNLAAAVAAAAAVLADSNLQAHLAAAAVELAAVVGRNHQNHLVAAAEIAD